MEDAKHELEKQGSIEDPVSETESLTRSMETKPEESLTSLENYSVTLELGDVIEIIAPSNPAINEITAYIIYIDTKTIKMVNVATTTFHQLHITEEGRFTDESISQIHLLSRSDLKGYARQNNLVPGKWVDIHFGGEIPAVITGEITNLEEDMIEVTTYPELRVIYINFGYKGIPESIPLINIVIREKPASIRKYGSLTSIKQQLDNGEDLHVSPDELANTEYLDSGESIITIPEESAPDENVLDTLRNVYVEANSIVFGEKLEAIAQLVEVPTGQKRYGIDEQTNNMMDELLSTIPNGQRTAAVLSNIHLLIERFKQLRSEFSKFDDNQNVYEEKTVGAYYKPLVENIHKLNLKLKWIVPVVSNRRKIYDMGNELTLPDIVSGNIIDELSEIQTTQEDYYKNNSRDPLLNYTVTNRRMDNLLKPFEELPDKDNALYTNSVVTNIDSIVDNLEDFKSSVVSNSEVIRRQYVIQRYNLGSNYMEEKLMKSGKTVFLRSKMAPDDTMNIKSLLMLPEPIVKFSAIDLPMTSLLEKSALHHNYFMLFRLLRKKTEILPQIIEDISTELDYENIEKETGVEFLSKIQEFILSPDADVSEEDKFKKFLEVIVPKTRFLIRAVRKHVTNDISFMGVLHKLEPFMIYPQDITYKQYMEIRYFIKDKISDLKKEVDSKSTFFSAIRNAKYNINKVPNTILRVVNEKKEFADTFYQNYRFLMKEKDKTAISPQEILHNMLEIDNGNLYTNIVTTLMISLMTPNGLTDALASPDLDDISELEKIKPTDCNRRFLTRRYSSLKELQKDNHIEEVYYDEDFDDTPYEILSKYKEEQKKMLPELFVDFLIENLIHKHDCPKGMAKELAETLLLKKKKIVDGEYAILELKPRLPDGVDAATLSEDEKAVMKSEADIRKKIQYYRRVKNTWVYDKDIGEESFIDNNTLFCNITDKCYKNIKNSVCESTADSSTRMKHFALKNMEKEFDKRFSVTVEELESELIKNIEYYLKKLDRLYLLKELQLNKANNLAVELGNRVSTVTLILSPNIKIRDLILGQGDFVKKQADICRFCDMYCRDPMVAELEENFHWLYCKDTNTKLMPKSLFELATTFVTGGNYSEKLLEVCRFVGIQSDDGDSIVDKHSGYVLQKMDFSSEEGFDESGFRVTTHDILQKDLSLVLTEAKEKKEKPIFTTQENEYIYNIFSTICSNIDIPIDGIDEFVLRVSNEIIDVGVMKEASYEKSSEAAKKKTGKALQPYKNYRNETIITIVACVVLVAIQTAVPSFQPRKTLAGCVRSFSGYPLDGGVEDNTGIKYIGCALEKSKSMIPPWDSIQRLKADTLVQRMKIIIDKYFIGRSDINELFIKKREYILLNPALISTEEHNISKWLHYLPPIVRIEVSKKLRNVSSDFISEFKELIQKGSSEQSDSINVMKSKVVLYGYSLIETINAIVSEKDLLLKTYDRVPFLENACCNESTNSTNPILYFNQENDNIRICIKATKQLAATLNMAKNLAKASLLYNPEFTGISYPSLPTGQLLENMYSAILFYCNFDSELPIPEIYKAICPEKPENYNIYWSTQEKIEFLKKNGKNYDIEHLNHLMKLVTGQNLIVIEQPVYFTMAQRLRDSIEVLDMGNSTVIEEPLREHLRRVLDNFDPRKYYTADFVETKKKEQGENDSLTELKDYLTKTNRRIYKLIMDYFDTYGKLSTTEYNKLHDFLLKIQSWQVDSGEIKEKYYDEGLYTSTQFIKNAIQNISRVYPSILMNDSGFYKKVHAHWGLSDKHRIDVSKFINKYYEEIDKFKQDKILIRLLQEMDIRLIDILQFVENIPIYTPISKEVGVIEGTEKPDIQTFYTLFDKETVYLLFSNCFYSVLYEFMIASDDKDLLSVDREDSNDLRKEKVHNENLPYTQLHGKTPFLDDQGYEEQKEQNQQYAGKKEELKERVCSLLLTFLNIEKENKTSIDLSYKQIMQKVGKSKEKEKKGIIEYLEKMAIDERKVEDALKNYRIGRWNVGEQKGLTKYDKNTYDRERDELLSKLYDPDSEEPDVVNEMLRDVYDIEEDEEKQAEEDYQKEMFDIEGLNADYMDGVYYDEDRNEDDVE